MLGEGASLESIGRAIGGDRLLTTREAAERVGRSEQSLKLDRVRKVGMPFVRLGNRRIAYRESDVDLHIEARARKTSRSEFDGAFRLNCRAA